MKIIKVRISDANYNRLTVGVNHTKNVVYDTVESLAALAIDAGLHCLEGITFDVTAAICSKLPASKKIPAITMHFASVGEALPDVRDLTNAFPGGKVIVQRTGNGREVKVSLRKKGVKA